MGGRGGEGKGSWRLSFRDSGGRGLTIGEEEEEEEEN